MSHQRFVILAIFLGAAFMAGILHAALASAFLQLAWVDTTFVGGVVSTSDLVAMGGGLATFFLLLRNRRAVKFIDEVIGEFWKVTWPTRDEALQAASTVVFTAIFVALVIGVYDFVWKKLADFFLFTEG